MAVTSNSIITPQAVKTGQAICTAAKTTYNDATNAVALLTAGANGAIVYSVKAVPRATVTATQCQLFRTPDGTTSYRMSASASSSSGMSTMTT